MNLVGFIDESPSSVTRAGVSGDIDPEYVMISHPYFRHQQYMRVAGVTDLEA